MLFLSLRRSVPSAPSSVPSLPRTYRRAPRSLWLVATVLVSILSDRRVCNACSNVLVTPGATKDGRSAMLAYNADDTALIGQLYHYPATRGQAANNISVYEWDTGTYLGEIAQVDETYNVVGNSNEHGLVIGETTFGGVDVLSEQPGGIIDYGSLIYLTLQRAKTARDAIETMNTLLETYGYASTGESFSIVDRSGEVWVMDLIGRGDTYGKRGAVWVAYKIPDGAVSAHANQARITTFPRNKPDHCLYSEDVVDVAIHYGLYPADADPADFSFSDVYAPVTFGGARYAEARVWSVFSQIVDDSGDFRLKYQEYATGAVLSPRMPLFVTPSKKLDLSDLMSLMTSHYEGTVLDPTNDVGGGVYGSPVRPRPLTWEYQGNTYLNERTLATYRTGWNFCAEIRTDMPRELSTVFWFAVDDSSTTPRFPIYSSSTSVPKSYGGRGDQEGNIPSGLKFDLTHAFWVQNMVSNFCYFRWSDAYPYLRERINAIQYDFAEEVKVIDQTALQLYKNSSAAAAVEYVTEYSVAAGDRLHSVWLDFYGELFVRFRDYSVIVPDRDDRRCGCDVRTPGYSDEMKRRIVFEKSDHYRVPPAKTGMFKGSTDMSTGTSASASTSQFRY